MYCSSCGAFLAQGLNYCNRCGVDLSPSESLVSAGKPTGLVWVISLGLTMTTGVAVGGLALVFIFVQAFIMRGFPIEATIILAIFSLSLLFGTTVLLSRQLTRLVSTYLESGEIQKPKKLKLSAKQPAEIAAPCEPISSVTEHTTRTLEPMYQEGNT